MQVIGLCRFSYPAIGGFQVHHESVEDRKSYLWAPHRMDERFRLFETITLPSLRAQTDQDFHLIVVIGDDFPAIYLERLMDLVEDLPQIEVQPHPPAHQRTIMKKILQSARMFPGDPCLQFRLDDDDAVAIDFVANLRSAAQDCRKLCQKNRCVGFDWPKGYLAQIEDRELRVLEQFRPLVTAALAVHVRGGANASIMNFSHHKMHRAMPVVSLNEPVMWIRTHNEYNDSRQKPVKTFDLQSMTLEDEITISERFRITNDQVRQVFAEA